MLPPRTCLTVSRTTYTVSSRSPALTTSSASIRHIRVHPCAAGVQHGYSRMERIFADCTIATAFP